MDYVKRLPGVQLYARWINCIKEKCGESYGGKCHVKYEEADYPLDGKCVKCFYHPIDKIDLADIEAFETIKQASEVADIPF